jgi:5-(carboxyamino)imidazole ribonucleotide mutase
MQNRGIAIIIGSKSDWMLVEKALASVEQLELSCTVKIASAHRSPKAVEGWVAEAEQAGVKVFIAIAGMTAALPGVVAAYTLLPVIGVPVERGMLRGQDALYSIAQMPLGVPVATVGINSVQNALLLAAEIIALHDPELKKRLEAFRKSRADKIDEEQAELLRLFPHLALHPPKEEAKEPEPIEEEKKRIGLQKPPEGEAPKKKLIYEVDPDNPSYATIERAADTILDGGIIAIPTDTVYGLACDATNARAVKKLYELKGRNDTKPIAVLIDRMRTLSRIIQRIPKDVEEMLEELWPGALTVVFPKPEAMLSAVSPGPSIGVRIPDCIITLGVISMLARPLAVTSANPSGQPPATNAAMVEKYFGSEIDMILDNGKTEAETVSTVLSVVEEPYTILREGALSFETLRNYLKNLSKK